MINIIKIILMTAIVSTESFMNLHSSYMRPLRYKPKTSLRCNYLESIENASNYNRTIPTLLPKPTPTPIPSLTYDQLFLILFSVTKIYISSNSDRIIVEYDNRKGVFYITNFIERHKIEFLISLINVDVTIVNDYPTKMDYPNGELYCSPNFSMKINITEAEIEDIINGIIHKYETGDETSEDYYDPDEDIDTMI
jgi:hypothetical protein